jgi:hypothetical protein
VHVDQKLMCVLIFLCCPQLQERCLRTYEANDLLPGQSDFDVGPSINLSARVTVTKSMRAGSSGSVRSRLV